MDRRKLLILRKRASYQQRVKTLFGSSLVAYWPLDEASGTVARDASGNSRNGTYANVTLGNEGIGDGRTSAGFNGTSTRLDVYSASLRAAFNGAEGFASIFYRATDLTIWANATNKRAYEFFVDGSNYVAINVSNAAIDFQYFAGGVQKTLRYTVSTTTAQWLCLILSWSKSGDAMKVYVNGTKALATGTGLGTFAGLLHATYTRIGSLDTASGFMKGNLAHCILGNRPITDAEALIISRNFGTSKISILGDSISSADGSYAYYAVAGYPTISTIINHAVGGHTIIDNMDAQTLAAANDGAYKIIIQLGTNDNNAGDMTALQAKAEAKIVELKASNPAATIYWMNVLPRWTNTGGGTVVDKSNIRTAIAAACTAQSVTCWDTFSTPWITAAQTADGLHPNTAGHVAIAAQVLARL